MSFSEDLARIRTAQNLTIQDVHEQIKVPLQVLKSIEDGSIFSDDQRNTTYVRSFVRTYAKALKIKDDDAIRALDLNHTGEYDGFLAELYLDENERLIEPKKDEPISTTGLKRADEGAEGTYGAHLRVEYSRPDPDAPHNVNTPPPPKIGTVNWADLGGKKAVTLPINYRLVGISVTVVVAIVLLGYYIATRPKKASVAPKASSEAVTTPSDIERQTITPIEIVTPEPSSSGAQTSTPSTSPTAQAQTPVLAPVVTPSPAQRPSRTGVLPDTLSILIYASKGNLEPVRIKSDLSTQWSPYWIEETHAMRVTFLNEVTFRGQYDRMTIIFNGHVVQNFRDFRGPEREIILNRSIFEKDARYLNVVPDSLIEGVTRPERIYNRPTF